ncbi:hypothetical protein ZWY2020_009168 [Hordeum vulgare]|nr:hypothetical protein ZWY2020_009168 [Hordeum vulgare]
MAAEWTDDNTWIVTELFAGQVGMGNRPNTHLTSNAYEEVANQFKMKIGLDYKRDQFKNKWDKLKADYHLFKKLRLRETGAGWDYEQNTLKQDDEWWKKAKQEIKGVGKFRKQGLRNEANLKVMFEDIKNDGSDHWNPGSGIPPPSSEVLAGAINVDDIHDCDLEEAPPTPVVVGASGSAEEITRIGNIAERCQSSFESFIKNDETTSVTFVMDMVIACGANEGSDEHFISIEVFVKRDQREMFLHMNVASRLGWLRRKYDNKYPK